jgi:hypothetical protein
LFQGPCPQPAGFAIDHARTRTVGMRGQVPGDGVRQHVPPRRGLVPQHAIEQQIDGLAIMHSQEGAIGPRPLGDRRAGFREEDMGRQVRELNIGADVSRFVEEGRPQFAEAKTASQAGRIAVAVDRLLYPLRGHVLTNRLVHFHENEPPVSAIGFHRAMLRRWSCVQSNSTGSGEIRRVLAVKIELDATSGLP